MNIIEIEVNEQEIIDQLDKLLKTNPEPASLAIQRLADKITIRTLKLGIEQNPKWRRSLIQSVSDAAKGVQSAVEHLKNRDSYLWVQALSEYLDEGGKI